MQLNRVVVSNIEKAERGIAGGRIRSVAVPLRIRLSDGVAGANDAIDNVHDVGEVASMLAVVEDLNGLTGEDAASEEEEGHVRSAPWPIRRKEPKTGGGKAKEMAVTVRHQFIGALGGSVKLERVIDSGMLGKWQRGIRPVDAASARIGEVGGLGVAARFEDICESDDVALDIRVWILQ